MTSCKHRRCQPYAECELLRRRRANRKIRDARKLDLIDCTGWKFGSVRSLMLRPGYRQHKVVFIDKGKSWR